MSIRRFVSSLLALFLVLVVFASVAQAGPVDQRVKNLLDTIGRKYTIDKDNDFKLIFSFPDDNNRTQVVFINSNTNSMGNMEIREIYSAACLSEDGPFPAEVMNRLMQDSTTRKIGAWEVQTSGNTHIAMFVARVPAEVDGETLNAIVGSMAALADDMEKEIMKGDDTF